MITAVDTNILLDILIPDAVYLSYSIKILDEYLSKGQLIICELVYAELAAQFPDEQELQTFLSETGIRILPSNEKALYLAGRAWKEYTARKKSALQCQSCGQAVSITCLKCNTTITHRQHIISDFIIGAHALVHSEILLSRDRGFYRTYFKTLKVVQ